MKDYKETTQKLYPVPANVQELIPVYQIARDGVFQLEKKTKGAEVLFDKAYLFLDTNFAAMDEFEKEDFLKLYCPVLNAMNVSFKLVVMNNNQNMDKIRSDIFIRNRDGQFAELVHAMNQHIQDVMQEGHAGIEQIRLLVITCRRKTVEQARDYFASVESGIDVSFKRMRSGLIPLDAKERLRYLHAFYNLGCESRFEFDFERALRRKTDWKDLIAPRTVKHWQNEYGDFDGMTVQIDNRFVRALYAPTMPNSINTDIIHHLMSGSYHIIITQDIAPIPQDVTRKRLMDLYMQTGRAIEKQQEARNKAMQWSSPISYDKQKELDELTEYMDIINENDEKMFYLGLYAVITADSRTELDNAVVAFCAAAAADGFQFEPAYWKQLEVVNTALPVGCRFVEHMYPLFTQPLAAITPFITHELCEKDGIFYGINQISKNVLVGNRKNLMNGNGFILGSTGAGKGFETKNELVQVDLRYPKDDIIVIDPQNEYRGVAEYLGGQFVDFGAEAGQHINPLDTDTLEYMESKKTFLQDKSELLLSIFSQILDGGISAQDKSLLIRCLTEVYRGLPEPGKGKITYTPPILSDLLQTLVGQREERAQELALALELFTSGGLDMFDYQTNINIKNRFVVFGIANLGKEQSAVGMIVMLESIRSRIAFNAKRGKATWLFVDEFHNLTGNEYSAIFFEKIWKEVRKLGGLCTAITQNISDLLTSKTVETMLMNSEYINLLSQKPREMEILRDVIGVTDHLLQYVYNAPNGCGLLKFGDRYIPKDNRLPKESLMYQLYNTNFHEIQKQKKKKKTIRKETQRLPELVKQVISSDPTEGERIYP
jgi:hypothetical protein